MEDTSVLSPLSLVVIVVCLFIFNLVIIAQDLICSKLSFWHLANFSSEVALFLWRHSKKRRSRCALLSDTDKSRLESSARRRISVGEVKAMIDEFETLYDDLVDVGGGEGLFENNEMKAEEVEEAFRLFDQNGDGFIDEDELRRVLRLLGFDECTKNDCRTMIGAFDENGDGKIDLQEFSLLLKNSFS